MGLRPLESLGICDLPIVMVFLQISEPDTGAPSFCKAKVFTLIWGDLYTWWISSTVKTRFIIPSTRSLYTWIDMEMIGKVLKHWQHFQLQLSEEPKSFVICRKHLIFDIPSVLSGTLFRSQVLILETGQYLDLIMCVSYTVVCITIPEVVRDAKRQSCIRSTKIC